MDRRTINIHAVSITSAAGQGPLLLPKTNLASKKRLNAYDRPVVLTVFRGLGQGVDGDSRDKVPSAGPRRQPMVTHQNRGAVIVIDPAKRQARIDGFSSRVIGGTPSKKESRHEMD